MSLPTLSPAPVAGLSRGVAVAAVALPLLVPFSTVPDAVLLHQLLALAGWGVWLMLALPARGAPPASPGPTPGLGLTLLLALLAGVAWQAGQPAQAAVLMAAALIVWVSAREAAAGPRAATDLARPMATAWWLAGLGCAAVAGLQLLMPEGGLAGLLSPATTPGRAVGNMRQPNHLATALLCAMVWTVWRGAQHLQAACSAPDPRRAGHRARLATLLALGLMLLGLAASASRTGALSLVVLLLWGVLDRRLPRSLRLALLLSPLVYVLAHLGLAAWAREQHAAFIAAERFQFQGDISSSRFAIWRDTLDLIAAHPWTGVGWGRFNLAWTFSAFPERPAAFFDHTHNLPLQLAVELGLPATAALLGALLLMLWQRRAAWSGSGSGSDAGAHPGRAVLVMLTLLAVHSQLEYPLWYAYFLLPAAWALGLWLGAGAAAAGSTQAAGGEAAPGAGVPRPAPVRGLAWVQGLAGGILVLAALAAGADHRRVEAVFQSAAASPLGLAERIQVGRESPLFGHHADYAAATLAPEAVPLTVFARPLDHLIDVRLMLAYARALHAAGGTPQAQAVLQRLREFRRPEAEQALAQCAGRTPSAEGLGLGAWACVPPAGPDPGWQALRAPADGGGLGPAAVAPQGAAW